MSCRRNVSAIANFDYLGEKSNLPISNSVIIKNKNLSHLLPPTPLPTSSTVSLRVQTPIHCLHSARSSFTNIKALKTGIFAFAFMCQRSYLKLKKRSKLSKVHHHKAIIPVGSNRGWKARDGKSLQRNRPAPGSFRHILHKEHPQTRPISDKNSTATKFQKTKGWGASSKG